ncbi:MAG: nitrogenase component 1 [Desulfovibrio sp.]|uniref:nitrogenase component 1 n=1 Tax=Desulfovibrio sp. TaxID=885 RepID=UPI0039E601C3
MLDLTPKTHINRTGALINPCKTCQPVGALLAALGVHNCMPYSHGSQGCVSYHRTYLSRHFKEPAIACTSSFTEGACVFGGGANIRQGAKNAFDVYDPDIIAVHTTCLSETIGDDLNTYIEEMDIPEGKLVVHCNTPSYVGSHVTGFANMMAGFIKYLAAKGKTTETVGVFPGFVNPGDIREYKHLLKRMKIRNIMFPDCSNVMDAPMTGEYKMYPDGGTTIDEIRALGSCRKVLALGRLTSEEPASQLKRKCSVEYDLLPLPLGLADTDTFIMALASLNGGDVDAYLEEERGRLLDLMLDANPYFYGKKVAVYGDPDTVLGLARFCLELGMTPSYVLTGTPGEAFVRLATALFKEYGKESQCQAFAAKDLFDLHQFIKNEPVDLLLGNSHGKQIAKAENIPLVRAGFPILDRYGHGSQTIVGYRGAFNLATKIADALMDEYDRHCADEDLELVM